MRLSEFTQAISFLYLAVLVLVDARAHPEQFLHGLRNIFVSQAALDRGAGQIRELDVVL